MKELTIEEKAQRYDEAIKIAREINNEQRAQPFNVMTRVFPELKESEDEKIRKNIIATIHLYYGEPLDDEAKEMIAWLKKQGEQNLVKHFCDCVYVGCHINDCKRWCHSYQKEISYTACNSNCNRYSKPVNHAFNIGETITDGISAFKIADIKGNHYIADDGERVEIYMAHRYYTTIQNQGEQKPADKVEPKFKTGDRVIGIASGMQYYITEICDDYYNTESGCTIMFCAQDNFELSKQEPTWSEEDEVGLGDALWAIKQASTIAKDENDMGNLWYAENWLKSLKDRVQPKQEWSEEDESYLNTTIAYLKDAKEFKKTAENCINWLKSLKPQNRWKPSDEQMKQLGWIAEQNKDNIIGKELMTLYNDLKQLKQL